MTKKDPRIDAYIKNSAEFAQPILKHFRTLVHEACPEIEETMKWSFPHFDYKGSMLCSIASFKQHCAINFWKAALMHDAKKLTDTAKTEVAMGHLGRITSLKDLPANAVLKKYIKEGMKLNDAGIKLPVKTIDKKELIISEFFKKSLAKNKKALKTFEGFSYSNKKEYVEWVDGAKTDITRQTRMADALEWMAEGKIKNWKYLKP